MKRYLALLLALMMVSLAACSSPSEDTPPTAAPTAAAESTPGTGAEKPADVPASVGPDGASSIFTEAFKDFAQYRKDGEEYTVLYAVSWAASEYFVNSYDVWKPMLAEIGITLEMQGPEVYSVESQLALMESALLSRQYDAIIFYPVASDVFVPYIQEWWDTYGVPIICYGFPRENASGNYAIDSISYYAMGQTVGQAILEYVERNNDYFGSMEVIPVAALRQMTNGEQALAVDGMVDTITAADPRFQVVENKEQVENSQGVGVMETLLVSQPDIEIIVCQQDDLAMAASTAIKTASGVSEYISVWGCNGNVSAIEDIAAGGYIKGTVTTPIEFVGELWMQYLPIVLGAGRDGVIVDGLDATIPADEAFLVSITEENAIEFIAQ